MGPHSNTAKAWSHEDPYGLFRSGDTVCIRLETRGDTCMVQDTSLAPELDRLARAPNYKRIIILR